MNFVGILPERTYMSPRRTDYVKRFLRSDTTDNINNEIFKEKDGYLVTSKNLQKNEFPEVLDKKSLRAAVKFLKEQDGGLIYQTGNRGAFNPDLWGEYLDQSLSELEYSDNGSVWGWLNMMLAFVHGKAAVPTGFLYYPKEYGRGGETIGALQNNIKWDRSKGKFIIFNKKQYNAVKYMIDNDKGITLDAFAENIAENTGGNMRSDEIRKGVADAVKDFTTRDRAIATLQDYARGLFYSDDGTSELQPEMTEQEYNFEYAPEFNPEDYPF